MAVDGPRRPPRGGNHIYCLNCGWPLATPKAEGLEIKHRATGHTHAGVVSWAELLKRVPKEVMGGVSRQQELHT